MQIRDIQDYCSAVSDIQDCILVQIRDMQDYCSAFT